MHDGPRACMMGQDAFAVELAAVLPGPWRASVYDCTRRLTTTLRRLSAVLYNFCITYVGAALMVLGGWCMVVGTSVCTMPFKHNDKHMKDEWPTRAVHGPVRSCQYAPCTAAGAVRGGGARCLYAVVIV